ncbi:MAG: efflux RND transporter permease subunit, partial [Gemmatimonadota bacterium]
IGMAVVASSLTTMCVFIPFFFLTQSRMTTWMRDAGLTICMAVAVSTVISLTLIPLGASRLFREEYGRYDRILRVVVGLLVAGAFGWKIHEVGWAATARWLRVSAAHLGSTLAGMQWTTALGFALVSVAAAALAWRFHRHGMRASYVSLLNWTLDHRAVAVGTAVMLIFLGNYLYGNIQQQGTPWQPERRVDITVEVERSYSLEEVRQLFTQLEQLVLAHRQELDVESVRTRFGQRGGTLSAQLVEADAGHLSTLAAGAAVQKLLPERVGVVYRMGRSRSWSGNTLGVEVQVKGPNQDVLAVLAEEVATQLGRLAGVKDVDTSLEDGEEEIRVEVDREQALEYGLSPRAVASSISAALGTRRTTTFKTGEREIDVVLQLEDQDRTNLEELKNTRFQGRNDTRIQLGALANFRFAEGPRALRREDRLLTLNVFANTADQATAMRLMQRDKATGSNAVEELMNSIPLPSGYSWQMGRVARWMQEDTSQNNFTLLFALLLIYLIMASLFESLVHPFTIMLAIPFSLIGVALGLWAFDVPFDNNGVLGLLILFGIVVNNGIVLVDHINHYRREGLDRRAAILRGGQNRMRPILMTALTTILNLVPLVLPMVYGTSEGFARRWGPVGLVVMSGLASSTVLTLVFAPTLYSLLDDLALWMRRVARAMGRSQ